MIPPPPRSTLFPYTTLFRSTRVLNWATLAIGSFPGLTKRSRESWRSEEHTSELQSLTNLVCRLLLEKKKKAQTVNRRRNRPDDKERPILAGGSPSIKTSLNV